MDREPDDELFGDDIGLIGWLFCWTPAPGCEDTLFGGNDCCWLFVAMLEAFSVEFCAAAAAAAAAASACKNDKRKLIIDLT